MKNYIQPGDAIDYTADESVASGDLVADGALVGVAVADIAVGARGVLKTEGVFALPKTAAALVVGDVVYSPDGVAEPITKTASGNTRVGVVVAPAAAADATARVKLG